jgi:hypothetical protein
VRRDAPAGGGAAWFVQAGGRVWGPYTDTRLAEFVAEGRVAAATLVGRGADGPFHPAVRQAGLRSLFGAAEPAEAPRPTSAPQPMAAVEPRAAPARARPLLVWAVLQSLSPERFETLVAGQGPFVRIQPGLWLVRTGMSPASLRNALTRRLDARDRLMVLEAALQDVAWFNIDGETDRTLRALWGEA